MSAVKKALKDIDWSFISGTWFAWFFYSIVQDVSYTLRFGLWAHADGYDEWVDPRITGPIATVACVVLVVKHVERRRVWRLAVKEQESTESDGSA